MKPLARRLRSLRNAAQAELVRHERGVALAALRSELDAAIERDRLLARLHHRVLAYLPVGVVFWMRLSGVGWQQLRFHGATASGRFLVFTSESMRLLGWPRLDGFQIGYFLHELCAGNVLAERP